MPEKRTFNRDPHEVVAEAEALAKAMGDGWTYEHHQGVCWYFSLVDPQNRHIHVSLNDAPKQYRMTISWPSDKRHQTCGPTQPVNDSIGCNFQRGPEGAAKEIKKRLLPILDEHWQKCCLHASDSDRRELNRQATVGSLIKRFGRSIRPRDLQSSEIYGDFGIQQVRVDSSGETAIVKTYSLPIAVVEQIIDLCKKQHKD